MPYPILKGWYTSAGKCVTPIGVDLSAADSSVGVSVVVFNSFMSGVSCFVD